LSFTAGNKKKIFAAAVLIAAIAAASAGSSAAKAATPSCGPSCLDLFSREFGTHHTPGFVLDIFQQGVRAGQPAILYRTSNSDPAEDFTAAFQGLVSDFYGAGMVSAAVELHYGGGLFLPTPPSKAFPDEPAFEIEYAPLGQDTGLCLGVPFTAFQHERVSLQPCGVSSKTVWIADSYDQPLLLRRGYVPLINGSDANFSHPFVLTYPSNSYPTDKPRPQLQVTNLTGFSNGFGPIVGTVPDSQLWGADFGVLR
jgi:hypothetical protein